MNMQNLMAQAQRMQKDIQAKQEQINKQLFIGESQAVAITINGKKEMTDIKIDKSIIKDSEDIEALEEMITIAFNNALEKVNQEIDTKLGVYAKGLNGLM